MKDIEKRLDKYEKRLENIETIVTSNGYDLNAQLESLDEVEAMDEHVEISKV